MMHEEFEDETAQALRGIAHSLRDLGLRDAGTSMGALEVLSKEVRESGERIAGGLSDVAEAIRYAADLITAPRAERPELVARFRGAGLTQQETADTLGIGQKTVSRHDPTDNTGVGRPVSQMTNAEPEPPVNVNRETGEITDDYDAHGQPHEDYTAADVIDAEVEPATSGAWQPARRSTVPTTAARPSTRTLAGRATRAAVMTTPATFAEWLRSLHRRRDCEETSAAVVQCLERIEARIITLEQRVDNLERRARLTEQRVERGW